MNLKLLDNEFIKIKKELIYQLGAINYPDNNRIAREIIEFLVGKYPRASAEKISKLSSDIIYRLSENEPWEYVRGWAEFCGYRFLVDKNVLIPRPETEDLVNLAVKDLIAYAKDHPKEKISLIDVGTGSGCIINSIALKIIEISPTLSSPINFIATDINPTSLSIAKKNTKKLGNNVAFYETNLIDGLKDFFNKNSDRKTFIVANLPYIPSEVCKKLDRSVIDYEPHIALDGGISGTVYYEELLAQLTKFTVTPIEMIWEIDQLIEVDIMNILHNSSIIKDYTNKTRFVKIN